MSDLLHHLIDQLEAVYGGKRWIIATDVLAGARGTTHWLQQLGAEAVLCIASSRGAGPAPDEDFAPNPIVFNVAGQDMMSSVRLSAKLLADLPAEARARVDAFDPQRTARVIGTIFDDGRPVGDRRKYGARPQAWQDLEDKTVIDQVWDDIGVPREPCEVVAAHDFDALLAASARLDQGAGTVWAADQREGFHGGASYTRRVTNDAQARVVFDLFGPHADYVRVMPFLEGIVCSVHGLVFDDYVAAFRPCEMLCFRRPDGRFHYGRAATFWDPPTADREAMREMARVVGRHLRAEFGYRGAFTIDGVMTADGFRPTELNPRFGAALGVLASPLDLDMVLLNLAVAESEPCDWRPADLEALVLGVADAQRSGGTMAVVSVPLENSEDIGLIYQDGVFRRAHPEEEPHAIGYCGPHAAGGIVNVKFVPAHTPVGESVSVRAAAGLKWADEEWGLDLGPMEPPQDVRRG